MNSFGATLLLVTLGANGPGQPADGIYRQETGPLAARMTSQDGQPVSAGARQTLTIRKSEITAQNNANDMFQLSLTIPYDEHLDPGTYLLIVAGTAYRQMGSGASQNESSSITFYISREENARQVSRYFKTPIFYRRHPGHLLRTSFTPTQREFMLGDEVKAILTITNVGGTTVAFMKGGRNRAARDNQYIFSARYNGREAGDTGTSYHFGGLAARRILKPGESFEDEISLSRWFPFDRAGTYEIHGSYYLDFHDPGADWWRTVWEDYVSADFLVTIRKP